MKKFTLGSMLALALATLSACAPANQNSSSANDSADNIVRGHVVSSSEAVAKQLVMLYGLTNEGGQQSAFICTATLISPTVLMTAAHCADGALKIYAVFATDGIAALKQANPASNPNIVRVAASRIYPTWVGTKNGEIKGKQLDAGDIALLKLAAPAPATAKITRLYNGSLQQGETLLAAGYGIDSVGQTNNDSSGLLREANVLVAKPLVGKSEFFVDQRGSNPGPCSGDSGGPTFVQSATGDLQQVGIVSRGDENCAIGGIYTLVPAYTSWISNSITAFASM
jgi:secreted trypsin-like serine protease